jgi:hypothetical protein
MQFLPASAVCLALRRRRADDETTRCRHRQSVVRDRLVHHLGTVSGIRSFLGAPRNLETARRISVPSL